MLDVKGPGAVRRKLCYILLHLAPQFLNLYTRFVFQHVKSKRRQEEMQKKAKLRIEAMKSLETDCIKAKQLMKQFKSLSMTTLDRVGKDGGDCVNLREESSGKRRVNSWHI